MIDESQRSASATAPSSLQPAADFERHWQNRQWLSRLAINQITTRRWSTHQEIDELRSMRVGAIGVWASKLDDDGSDARLIRSSRLAVSSLSWIDGLTCGEWDRTSEAVSNGGDMIRLGAFLKAEVINVVTGTQGGHIRSNAKRLVVHALRELADEAARWNVQLALQPMHRVCKRQWTFLHSIEETMDVINAVDRPRLGMTCSTFHLSRSRSLCRRIREFADWIRLVQLCDGPRRPRNVHHRNLPGEGELPLADIVATLEEAGYQGRYEVEVMSPEVWEAPQESLLPSICNRFVALRPRNSSPLKVR
jgi:sugar phosphate isomerase/epimerase